jgi:hypothetical protein
VIRDTENAMDTLIDPVASTSERSTTEATFTKWMVGEGPDMTGVVGGAVGQGIYRGRVLDYTPGPTQRIVATYSFEGSERSFTALVYVEQTGLDGDVSGVVTDGWGKGRPVRGAFREIQCEHDGTTTDCWSGSLSVLDD